MNPPSLVRWRRVVVGCRVAVGPATSASRSGTSSGGADVRHPHLQELVARIAVVTDCRVVDLQKAQALDVVHPHRLGVLREELAAAARVVAIRRPGPPQLVRDPRDGFAEQNAGGQHVERRAQGQRVPAPRHPKRNEIRGGGEREHGDRRPAPLGQPDPRKRDEEERRVPPTVRALKAVVQRDEHERRREQEQRRPRRPPAPRQHGDDPADDQGDDRQAEQHVAVAIRRDGQQRHRQQRHRAREQVQECREAPGEAGRGLVDDHR